MTNRAVYVGIEQEFQLMDTELGEHLEATEQWLALEEAVGQRHHKVFHISPTAVRTRYGNGRYCDQEDLEVCTPPVRVQRGFTRSAADYLYLARKELVEFISPEKNNALIGYSTHWNLTDVRGYNDHHRSWIMNDVAIPLSLLTLTPISSGINMRDKNDGRPGRLELLGDYIENLDQARALLLFYSGVMLNYQKNESYLPITPVFEEEKAKHGNEVPFGRETAILVKERTGSEKIINAQEYLERYYSFFKQGIAQVGDEEEVKNLEDFITGRKKLEIDHREKYSFIFGLRDREDFFLRYHPSVCLPLEAYREDRALPTAVGQFLGSLATLEEEREQGNQKSMPFKVRTMAWDKIILSELSTRYIPGREYSFENLENIELAAELTAMVSRPSEKARLLRFLYWTQKREMTASAHDQKLIQRAKRRVVPRELGDLFLGKNELEEQK